MFGRWSRQSQTVAWRPASARSKPLSDARWERFSYCWGIDCEPEKEKRCLESIFPTFSWQWPRSFFCRVAQHRSHPLPRRSRCMRHPIQLAPWTKIALTGWFVLSPCFGITAAIRLRRLLNAERVSLAMIVASVIEHAKTLLCVRRAKIAKMGCVCRPLVVWTVTILCHRRRTGSHGLSLGQRIISCCGRNTHS